MVHPTPVTVGDESASARCPHCSRPFPDEHLLELHLGERHPGALTDAEHDAYETAREAETEELFLFHLKVIVAIGILYAVFVLVYMVVLA